MLDLDELLKPDNNRSKSIDRAGTFDQKSGSSRRPIVWSGKIDSKKQRLHSVILGVVGLLAAVLATQVWSANDARTTVVVAVNDLAPGEVITASDIKLIEADLISTMFEQRSDVVGQRVREQVLADEPVLMSDLGDGIELPEGLVVSGLSVRPGAYPAVDLVPGDSVDVTGVNPVTGVAELIADDVQIFSVGTSGFGTDELFISVAVSPAQSLRIANSVNQAEGVRIALRAQSDS